MNIQALSMFDYQQAQMRQNALADWALGKWGAGLGAQAIQPSALHCGHETHDGALLKLRGAQDACVRVLELGSDEHCELPLFTAVQQDRGGGTFSPGWMLTAAPRPQELQELLLWLSPDKHLAILVPSWAWWQAGFLLWETLLRLSSQEEHPYRPNLRLVSQAQQPVRLHGSAQLPLSWWLRTLGFLTPTLDKEALLVAGLRDDKPVAAPLVKAYWATQDLPALRLPGDKALQASLRVALGDGQAGIRAGFAQACAPAAMALCAQAAYFESVHSPQAQGLSSLKWEPLQGTEHLWPAGMQALQLRTAPVSPARLPSWATVLAALQEEYGAAQKEDLASYFEKHHH